MQRNEGWIKTFAQYREGCLTKHIQDKQKVSHTIFQYHQLSQWSVKRCFHPRCWCYTDICPDPGPVALSAAGRRFHWRSDPGTARSCLWSPAPGVQVGPHRCSRSEQVIPLPSGESSGQRFWEQAGSCRGRCSSGWKHRTPPVLQVKSSMWALIEISKLCKKTFSW